MVFCLFYLQHYIKRCCRVGSFSGEYISWTHHELMNVIDTAKTTVWLLALLVVAIFFRCSRRGIAYHTRPQLAFVCDSPFCSFCYRQSLSRSDFLKRKFCKHTRLSCRPSLTRGFCPAESSGGGPLPGLSLDLIPECHAGARQPAAVRRQRNPSTLYQPELHASSFRRTENIENIPHLATRPPCFTNTCSSIG